MDTPQSPASRPDVIVVGGGVVGTSIAYRLAASGRKVALFEQRGLASGASGRNGGIISSGSSMHADQGDAVYVINTRNMEIVKGLSEELDADFELRITGRIEVATKVDDWLKMKAAYELLGPAGFDSQLLDQDEVRRILPAAGPAILGGRFSSNTGHLWPFALVHAFAAAARRLGTVIHQWTPVLELLKSGDRISGIRTAKQTFQADEIVLATNAYTPLLLDSLPKGAIVPARGQILVTQPMPSIVPFPFSLNGDKEYGRQVPGGPILCGGYRRLDADHGLGHYEERVSAPVLSGIARCLTTLFPRISDVQVVRCWAGIMGFTPDGVPLIGRSERHEGLTIAAGFNGGGFSWASATGMIVADLINGVDPGFDLAPFRPDRFDVAGTAWNNPFTAGEMAIAAAN